MAGSVCTCRRPAALIARYQLFLGFKPEAITCRRFATEIAFSCWRHPLACVNSVKSTVTRSNTGVDWFFVVSFSLTSNWKPKPSGSDDRSSDAGVFATCFAKPFT